MKVRATIERRLLVNYRIDVDALTAILPHPFRPAVVGGYGVGGICLIRLGDVRPAGVPRRLGITSENAAHRVAVEWDTADGPVCGVYISRRDSSSLLTTVLGGRAFPGWHHRADFQVNEGGGAYRVEMNGLDGEVAVVVVARRASNVVAARRAGEVMAGSVFASLHHASAFFRGAPVGYAATAKAGCFDGVTLTAGRWAMEPLQLDDVRSSFFEDTERFPPGTTAVDSAFLMENLDSTWTPQPALHAATAPA